MTIHPEIEQRLAQQGVRVEYVYVDGQHTVFLSAPCGLFVGTGESAKEALGAALRRLSKITSSAAAYRAHVAIRQYQQAEAL